MLKLVRQEDVSEFLDAEQSTELSLQSTRLCWLDMSMGDEDDLDVGGDEELSSLSSALKLP